MPSAPTEIASVAETTFTPFAFVMRRIVFIPCEAIKFSNNNNLIFFACTVFYHSLKVRTAVGSHRKRTVDVGFYNLNIILLGKGLTFAKLSFNRLFTLIIRRISCIDYAFHFLYPPFFWRV